MAAFVWGPGPKRPAASAAIGVALLVVFVVERGSGSWQHEVTNLRHEFGWSAIAIQAGDWWRLVTPAFLHSDTPSAIGPLGTEHLVANLLALALFAPRVECRRGGIFLVAAFIAFHIAAFAVWAVTDIPGSYFGVGASSAIVALALTAIVDAARAGERWYVAAAIVFALLSWWPQGVTSSDQVHIAAAVVGVAFALTAKWQWAALSAIAAAGTLVVLLADPSLPREPRRLGCPDAPYRWSGGEQTMLFVHNERDVAVRLWWTRPDGERVLIARLRRGDFVLENSFVGHRFAVTTERGRCLDVLEVAASTHSGRST